MLTRCRTRSSAVGSDGSPGAISASRSRGRPLDECPHPRLPRARRGLAASGLHPRSRPMPSGFELRDNWPQTTRGRVDGRRATTTSTTRSSASTSLSATARRSEPGTSPPMAHLPPLPPGLHGRAGGLSEPAPGGRSREAAAVRNPYREWIGALIRGDAFGWSPGRPVRRPSRVPGRHAYRTSPTASTERCGRAALVSCRVHRARGPDGDRGGARAHPAAFATSRGPQGRPGRGARGADVGRRLEQDIQHGTDTTAGSTPSTTRPSSRRACCGVGRLRRDRRPDRIGGLGHRLERGHRRVGGRRPPRRSLPSPAFHRAAPRRVSSALFGFDNSRISDLAARTTRMALRGLSDGVAGGALVDAEQAVG